MRRIIAFIIVMCVALTIFSGCDMFIIRKRGVDSKVVNNDDGDVGSDVANDGNVGSAVVNDGNDTQPTNEHAPLLWHIYNDSGEEMYLMGTIHVGDKQTKALTSEMAQYITDCDALAVEFDVVAYQKDMAAMQNDIMQFVCTDGTTIKDYVSKQMYADMVEFMKENYTYNAMFDYYNLAMWSQLINDAFIDNCTLKSKYGVDEQLIRIAYKNDIPVWDIESATMQYEMLNSISDEYYLLEIAEMIKTPLDEYDSQANELYTAYINGDEKGIIKMNEADTFENEQEKLLVEEYNKKVLYDRNDYMAQKAAFYMTGGNKVFFAVGCAHVVGEQGILQKLMDMGYKAERM